jgi:hypothetical protein
MQLKFLEYSAGRRFNAAGSGKQRDRFKTSGKLASFELQTMFT